jgi:hypothetical protein
LRRQPYGRQWALRRPASNADACSTADRERPISRVPHALALAQANEAATRNGEVQPDSKTAAFMAAVEVPVHVPLSGRTMEFDGKATCVSGC